MLWYDAPDAGGRGPPTYGPPLLEVRPPTRTSYRHLVTATTGTEGGCQKDDRAAQVDSGKVDQAKVPSPWARWRSLPSVRSAGATMTSTFWNSLIEE